MFGNPIGNPATGGPVRASLPGTTVGNPGPGADFIMNIKDDNKREVTAATLCAKQNTIHYFNI